MKLLIFCPYYPPHVGGLESHADEFNKHMAQDGFEITVFTPRLPADSLVHENRFTNVRVIRFPAWEIIHNYPLPKFWDVQFWQLFSSIWKEKYDAVISRTRFFNTSLLALIYARIKGIKWIHIEHGSDFVHLNNVFFQNLAKLYDYTFGKLVFIFADRIIANSKASAAFVRQIYSGKIVDVIHRGVDVEKIVNIEPDFDIKKDYPGPIIAYAGRLMDGKGIPVLLKAVKDLNNPEVTLFIIGAGSQRENLEALAKKYDISNQVVFWGHQNFEKLIALLKIADIVVNPSYTEGLPTSIIEAALCSKAIIATNVGGTPEIITNNVSGYLIPAKDSDTLTNKLQQLLDDSELRNRFGIAAKEEVMLKFNWSTSIAAYKDILKETAPEAVNI